MTEELTVKELDAVLIAIAVLKDRDGESLDLLRAEEKLSKMLVEALKIPCARDKCYRKTTLGYEIVLTYKDLNPQKKDFCSWGCVQDWLKENGKASYRT